MATKKRQPTKRRRARTQTRAGRSPEDRVIDAALALAASQGWNAASLGDIAAHAGISTSGLYALFPSKSAILDAFMRRNDRASLAGVDTASADGGSVRDRLFDLIMR